VTKDRYRRQKTDIGDKRQI